MSPGAARHYIWWMLAGRLTFVDPAAMSSTARDRVLGSPARRCLLSLCGLGRSQASALVWH